MVALHIKFMEVQNMHLMLQQLMKFTLPHTILSTPCVLCLFTFWRFKKYLYSICTEICQLPRQASRTVYRNHKRTLNRDALELHFRFGIIYDQDHDAQTISLLHSTQCQFSRNLPLCSFDRRRGVGPQGWPSWWPLFGHRCWAVHTWLLDPLEPC